MTDRWLPSHLTRVQLEERRLHFLQLLEIQQYSTEELAEFLGVSTSTIGTWKHLLRQQGSDALQVTVTTSARTLRGAAGHPEAAHQRRRARSRLPRLQLEHPPSQRRHRPPPRRLASPQSCPQDLTSAGLFPAEAQQTSIGTG